jgi:hypothetical protein
VKLDWNLIGLVLLALLALFASASQAVEYYMPRTFTLVDTNFTQTTNFTFSNGQFIINGTYYLTPLASINGVVYYLSQFPAQVTSAHPITDYSSYYKFGLRITHPARLNINYIGFQTNCLRYDALSLKCVDNDGVGYVVNFTDLANSGFNVTILKGMVNITNPALLSNTTINLDPGIGPMAILCDCDVCESGCRCGGECPWDIDGCPGGDLCCSSSGVYSCTAPDVYWKTAADNCSFFGGLTVLSCAVNEYLCSSGSYAAPYYASCTLSAIACSSGYCLVCGNCNGAGSCGTSACGFKTSAGVMNNCSGTNVCDGLGTGIAHCKATFGLGQACNCTAQCTSPNTCVGNICTAPATCSLTSGINPITFGNMNVGDTSPQDLNKTTINNTGNTATKVYVNSSAWTKSGASFLSNYTHWYNATGQTYFNKKWLNVTQQVLNNSLAAGISMVAFFDLWIPTGQASGSYTQTVWFTSSC